MYSCSGKFILYMFFLREFQYKFVLIKECLGATYNVKVCFLGGCTLQSFPFKLMNVSCISSEMGVCSFRSEKALLICFLRSKYCLKLYDLLERKTIPSLLWVNLFVFITLQTELYYIHRMDLYCMDKILIIL